jgi:hypothetical protein
MNDPKFSFDPAADRFINDTRAKYTQDSFDPTGEVDKSAARTNNKRMTDLTRQEVDAKLAQNKAELDARLANFDTSVKTGFADVKTGFAELKTEMQKMRGDFEKQSHDSTKWIIGSVFGMISLGVAIIGVMININKGEKPTPAAQAAPIVITIPAAAATPAQAPMPAQSTTK